MPTRPDSDIVVAVLHGAEGPPPGLDAVESRASVRLAGDGDALEAVIAKAQIILVTDFRSGALAAAWPRAGRLQWVHATSAGVDALLFPALVESDVPLTNARGIFDDAIAEYVLALIASFAKDLQVTFHLQRDRRWQHRDTERISGRRALIVGAGSIGSAIGRQLSVAGMTVTGVASRPRSDTVFGEVHGIDALPELLSEADYVVLALPLTGSTRGLFDAGQLRHMPEHARLINIGRGPLVRTEALVAALEKGHIAGAALDVFEQEPLPADHPLWTLPGVIVSPHMAGDFKGWRRALTEQFVDNFDRWRDGRELLNQVDKQKGYGGR